jgi:hypothetical protein
LKLTEVNVPRHLIGKDYASVRAHSVRQGNIALGLYRPSGTKGATMPYMATNPPPRTKVVPGDRVLVLRHTTLETFDLDNTTSSNFSSSYGSGGASGPGVTEDSWG